MHSWLVPRVVLPAYDRLAGRRLWAGVLHLRASQWRSADEVAARAAARLRALLAHAGRHVPFYREQFGRAGVDPAAIRGPEDLVGLPLTTKAALRARFPDGVVAENRPAPRRLAVRTSGSTGVPFEVLGDPDGADETLASYLFFLEWAGAAPWHTRLDLGVRLGRSYRSAPWLPRVPARLLRRLALGEDVRAVLGLDLPAAALRALVAGIPARRGYFVRAYPAYAAELGARLLAEGGPLARPPRVVISCSETLTAARGAAIARAFGAPVVNHYSSWEALHLAQSCPDNPAVLHVNPERAVLWIARPDGSRAEPGEHGRIVLTVLSNHVQPFVNYDIGDWGALGPACPCGRGWPTLGGLEGRTSEVIRTPSGRVVSAILVNQLTALSGGGILEYQLEQVAPDRVLVRVVPAAGFTPALAAAVRAELAAHLGVDVSLRVDVVDRIPLEPSGKRPVIVTRPGAAGAPAAPESGDDV